MLVTGAGPGSIGEATASTLRSWGAQVVTTTRTGGSHPLDLTDASSVRRFADWYAGHHRDHLDVLVNNAGVHLDLMSDWKQPHLLADGHEVHWRTNFLGTLHLTHLLLPALLATAEREGQARVVNVVSRLHRRGRNADLFGTPETYGSWDAYGRSKLALVLTTRELQRRHAAQGLLAFTVHPGAVLTDIASKGLDGHRLLGAVRRALRPVESLALLTPDEGAQGSLWCATAPEIPGGSYVERCRVAAASADADDAQVAARLWDETAQWVAHLH